MANKYKYWGEAENMEQVIVLFYDQIYKFCYWKTHSAVDAQDITQDTFIRFMNAAQTYSDIENPRALLYTLIPGNQYRKSLLNHKIHLMPLFLNFFYKTFFIASIFIIFNYRNIINILFF